MSNKYNPSDAEKALLAKYGKQYLAEPERSISRHKIAIKALEELKQLNIRWNFENLNNYFFNQKKQMSNRMGYDYYIPVHYCKVVEQAFKATNENSQLHDLQSRTNQVNANAYQMSQFNQISNDNEKDQCGMRNDETEYKDMLEKKTKTELIELILRLEIKNSKLKKELQLSENGRKLLAFQLEKKCEEIKTIQQDKSKTIDNRYFTISVLCTGLTYVKASDLLTKLSIMHPSQSTFYEIQNALAIEIDKAVESHLVSIRSTILPHAYLSFDGCWSHPRLARQCVGTLIDTRTGLIVDYFSLYFNMKGHDGNFTGFPNQMETEIFRRMAVNWIGDNRVDAIIEDCDNRNNSVYKSLSWSIIRLIDANHLRKHFKHILDKYTSLSYIHTSIIKHFNHIIKSKDSDDIKQKKWKNAIKHFDNDHSECSHKEIKDFLKVKADDRDSLIELVNKTVQLVTKIRDVNINTTNWNESYNHFRLYFCPKLLSTKISFKIRSSLSILFWNMGPTGFIYLLKYLNIVVPTELIESINKKQNEFEIRRKNRKGEAFRKKVNANRKKFKEETKKVGKDGYIVAEEDEEDEEDPYLLTTSDHIPDEVFQIIGTEAIEKAFGNDETIGTKTSNIFSSKPQYNIVSIRNIKNSCYINSAIQVLFRIKPLFEIICKNERTDWLLINLKDAAMKCSTNQMIDNPNLNYYCNKLFAIHKESEQEDSSEMLILILDQIIKFDKMAENCLLIETNKIFTCAMCHNEIAIIEKHRILTISIRVTEEIVEMKNLINNFLNPCFNSGGRFCQHCNMNTCFTYKYEFVTTSEYIVIHLNRFYKTGLNAEPMKINTSVLVNQTLAFNDIDYIFIGSINHKGSRESGHYFNFILHEGKYHYISDMVHEEKILPNPDESYYVLVYKKLEFNHE